MTLLDVGCGWGATMRRAIEKYDVNVVGLDVEREPAGARQQNVRRVGQPRTKRVLLQGWEQFDEPVDRIVSIGRVRALRPASSATTTSSRCAYNALPADGVMLLHTIVVPSFKEAGQRHLTRDDVALRFIQFILREIFPGGRLPTVDVVEEHATAAGFELDPVQSLRLTTRGPWTRGRQPGGQQGPGDRDPVRRRLQPLHEVPDRLRELFRDGYTDVFSSPWKRRRLIRAAYFDQGELRDVGDVLGGRSPRSPSNSACSGRRPLRTGSAIA